MRGRKSVECDVLIVGGGLVGSLLACALSNLPLSIVLVEARRVDSLEQPSFDSRATALANGSRRVLEQLRLWGDIQAQAQAIRVIHISERGRFGAARIDAREEGVNALGHTVENRVLGAALWQLLTRRNNVRCIAPAQWLDSATADDRVTARIDVSGERLELRSRLMVAADGAHSKLRHALGIGARVDDYEQRALTVNCTTQEPHRGRAFERFTPDGPLAFLPLTRNRIAVVWTLPANRAEGVLALPDDDFRGALQAAFGYRLGRLVKLGRRDMYALARVRSRELVRERTVLIGNAAIALHPVAGQGFNLALRDASALAEVIADAWREAGSEVDAGGRSLLERYRQWRADDQRKLAGFTHALVRGFGARAPGLSAMRGLGLMAFDLLPGAKSVLARHTMGLAGHVPRLARHLDLA